MAAVGHVVGKTADNRFDCWAAKKSRIPPRSRSLDEHVDKIRLRVPPRRNIAYVPWAATSRQRRDRRTSSGRWWPTFSVPAGAKTPESPDGNAANLDAADDDDFERRVLPHGKPMGHLRCCSCRGCKIGSGSNRTRDRNRSDSRIRRRWVAAAFRRILPTSRRRSKTRNG